MEKLYLEFVMRIIMCLPAHNPQRNSSLYYIDEKVILTSLIENTF